MDTITPNTVNLVEDFRDIHQTISDDVGGDKTRGLIAYYEGSAAKSQRRLDAATDAEEKELVGLVHDAYLAARSIVANTWEMVHGAKLG